MLSTRCHNYLLTLHLLLVIAYALPLFTPAGKVYASLTLYIYSNSNIDLRFSGITSSLSHRCSCCTLSQTRSFCLRPAHPLSHARYQAVRKHVTGAPCAASGWPERIGCGSWLLYHKLFLMCTGTEPDHSTLIPTLVQDSHIKPMYTSWQISIYILTFHGYFQCFAVSVSVALCAHYSSDRYAQEPPTN